MRDASKLVAARTAGFAAVLCGVILFLSSESLAAVPAGLSVGGQKINGLELEDAQKKLEEYAMTAAAQTVTLNVDGNRVEAAASELGIYWANENVLAEIVGEYETGNMIERYIRLKDLEMSPVDVPLIWGLHEDVLQSFVAERCAPFMTEAADAQITRENGDFVVTPSRDGIAVDVSATGQAILEACAEGLAEPVTADAVLTVTRPEKTTELLSVIQDVLGTYSTDFSGSSASRAANLAAGAGKINGTVLMPGETLSGYACMQPFTKENGYAAASAYENGHVVDSIGGGVCQIATTLYNAALMAEMDITQRQGHSMIVTYVPPSRDAAIAGTYKDIKITNPYDTPVYVEAGTSGQTLTFTIYGRDTRPVNRRVEYISETVSTTEPGDPVFRYDASLAPGAQVKVESSHRGRISRLWKCVYVDDVEVERTLLHTDTYSASPAVYRVGPDASSEDAVSEDALPGDVPRGDALSGNEQPADEHPEENEFSENDKVSAEEPLETALSGNEQPADELPKDDVLSSEELSEDEISSEEPPENELSNKDRVSAKKLSEDAVSGDELQVKKLPGQEASAERNQG